MNASSSFMDGSTPCRRRRGGERYEDRDGATLLTQLVVFSCGCRIVRHEYHDALRALFAEVGGVESAALVTDTLTGQSRGFGYVRMVSAEAEARAIKTLHRKEFDGRKLVVHRALPQHTR